MRSGASGFGGLLGTGFRGLRSRLLLTLGSVLLAAISVAAAVVGPMYQAGASASYLVTKLQSEPNFLTGLVFDLNPDVAPQDYPQGLVEARQLAAHELDDQFGPPTLALWTQRLKGFPGNQGQVSLVSASGQCQHVILTGHCPTKTGEALILKHDSTFAPLAVGHSVKLRGMSGRVTIVGTYAPRPVDASFWFNLTDLESVPPQPTGSGGLGPYHPAPLLVAPQTFTEVSSNRWYIRATRRLTVTPETTLADLQQATHVVAVLDDRQQALAGAVSSPGDLTPEFGNALVPLSQEIQQRRATAHSTVAPAVVSVILVALVLLLRLLAAAMELRRSELALASLRGFSRRQMWLLGLMEPALMLVIATPLGLVGGFLCARTLARVWLLPGLPTPFGVASLVAVLVVVLATAVVAAVVVRESLSEPLSAQIAGVRRPGRSGRWGMLLRLILVAGAVAVLVATLASTKKSSPDATDLALPILLAVAAGLVTTLAAQSLARSWASWTAGRRGVFSYLASRTISRRREGTLVILPLTAALAVAVFAIGVFTAAADWRASDAATIVGADESYSTKLTMDQAVALTHQIDPAGRWLMAVGAQYEGASQTLVLDTPRLARVGLWPASWTPGLSAADIARDLSVHRQSVRLVGSRLTMTVDNAVSGDYRSLSVNLVVTRSDGSTTSIAVGSFPPGTSTRSVSLVDCRAGCTVQQMSFGGPAGATEAMHGQATVSSLSVDGSPVPAAVDASWRVAKPLVNTPVAVAGAPQVGAGGLTVRFDARNTDFYAAITPGDVPEVRPVVLGRSAHPGVIRRIGSDLRLRTTAFVSLDVHPVATAESMPVLGPAGMMIDYTMLSRDVGIDSSVTFVTIVSRSDTPPSVVAALGAQGIAHPTTLSSTRRVLDQDAFALALNLYLVVTVIVIVLALAGLGANLTVQMPARRRDAASLRVVGLRRRSIMAAVVAEFAVVLGAAGLAGIASGSLAQYVVVRTVTLGYADTQHTPRLLPSFDLTTAAGLLVGVTAVLLVVAVTVAALTVRGARTASLRENAR